MSDACPCYRSHSLMEWWILRSMSLMLLGRFIAWNLMGPLERKKSESILREVASWIMLSKEFKGVSTC